MKAILLEKVSKTFGSLRAVDGLSMEVAAGGIYGFLGPNGAGKTTTIRMIMNIIRPDNGRIEIFGNKLTQQTLSRIGYMPEERGLYRKMTVSSTLKFFGGIKGLSVSELDSLIPQWLGRVGLSDWANKKVEELSRGMHQKLLFAVTAVNDPDLLILDEPFSGLDPINLDLLKGIIVRMRENGRTVIFSTHAMHDAEELCDFIFLIDKGKLVLEGSLDKIRSEYKSNAVSVEFEGDGKFIECLPMVESVEHKGRRTEIVLREKGDHQQLLQAIVGRVRVLAFEVKGLSLHEIFVKLVGAKK